MQYIVIFKDKTSFSTNWWNEENWDNDILCIINIYGYKITFDGKTWKELEEDHL